MLEQYGYGFAGAAVGGGGGGGGAETLTTLANIDLEANAINAIDLGGTVSTHVTTDGIATLETTGSRLSDDCYKFEHSLLTDGYSCFRNWDLASGNTFSFRRMAIRFEMQVGATWGSNNDFDSCKLMIVNMETVLGSGATTRPMLYLEARPGDETGLPTNYVMLGLAQGTNKRYSSTATVDYPDGTTPFFFGPTATTWSTRPVVGADEWVSISYYMNSEAETDWANGRLWMKVTRQNGDVLANFSFAYNIGSSVANDYIANLDVLGGYYNGPTDAQESTNYLKIAYPTFKANADAPLEPRTGFVA